MKIAEHRFPKAHTCRVKGREELGIVATISISYSDAVVMPAGYDHETRYGVILLKEDGTFDEIEVPESHVTFTNETLFGYEMHESGPQLKTIRRSFDDQKQTECDEPGSEIVAQIHADGTMIGSYSALFKAADKHRGHREHRSQEE